MGTLKPVAALVIVTFFVLLALCHYQVFAAADIRDCELLEFLGGRDVHRS